MSLPPKYTARPWWRRKRIYLLLAFVLLLVLHRQALNAVGQFLVVEDPAQKVDAIYVLSGSPADRGQEAAKLYAQGNSPEVVCLGGEKTTSLRLYGIEEKTCELTRRVVREAGVPEDAIRLLPEGTSTWEEFEAIKLDCKQRGYKDIMVVSSRFHTRRIHMFFRLPLHFEGINMVLRGSYELDFEESEWWKKEPGLLFVNNEFIKIGYYFIRY